MVQSIHVPSNKSKEKQAGAAKQPAKYNTHTFFSYLTTSVA